MFLLLRTTTSLVGYNTVTIVPVTIMTGITTVTTITARLQGKRGS